MNSAAPPPRREARVLVVDDEDNIRRLLRAILTRMPNHSCVVEEASSAEMGQQMLARSGYDLIITDYRMGQMTGVDLLAHAHDTRPEVGRMLITAFGELDIGVEAINRGHVDGFLRKPWENARLLALVESLLAQRLRPAAAAPPVPAGFSGASGIAQPSATSERAAIEQEFAQVDRALRQLRVRLGLGSISADGYQLAAEELGRKKAELEVRLLKTQSTL